MKKVSKITPNPYPCIQVAGNSIVFPSLVDGRRISLDGNPPPIFVSRGIKSEAKLPDGAKYVCSIGLNGGCREKCSFSKFGCGQFSNQFRENPLHCTAVFESDSVSPHYLKIMDVKGRYAFFTSSDNAWWFLGVLDDVRRLGGQLAKDFLTPELLTTMKKSDMVVLLRELS